MHVLVIGTRASEIDADFHKEYVMLTVNNSVLQTRDHIASRDHFMRKFDMIDIVSYLFWRESLYCIFQVGCLQIDEIQKVT